MRATSQTNETMSSPAGHSSASSMSSRRRALRGLSYDEQRQVLSPGSSEGVQATDIPGVLYSNTSKTNLNKQSDWSARLGFGLATQYEARVTFADLVDAGRRIQVPLPTAIGAIKVPAGAGTSDPREYDTIETPTGSVIETGSNRFFIRGGAGGPHEPVTLRFANNGGLNLARLARSAYELAKSKGVQADKTPIDWQGKTFALSCAVQMGNEVSAEGARAYGYVGEFELKWIQEKVDSTVEALVAATAVAAGRGRVHGKTRDASRWVHPYHESVEHLQTAAWETIHTDRGPVASRKQGVDPIAGTTFGHPTVQSWGDSGANQKAWVADWPELAARAQRRLAGAWAPGADWAGHPTYITECPDFTDVIIECFKSSQGTYVDRRNLAQYVQMAMKQIAARLQQAPMHHELIDDTAHQARLEAANKCVIAQAFSRVDVSAIYTRVEGLADARVEPHLRSSDTPVEDTAPNDEGLVFLRDWSSRDP